MKKITMIVLLLVGFIFQMAMYSLAGQLVVGKDMVNVRQEPTTKSAILARLNGGHVVEELQRQGRWVEVDLLGESKMSGWVFETLLKPKNAQETKSVPAVARMADNSRVSQLVVVNDIVNVRQGPTTKSAIMGRLNGGQVVEELQRQGRWVEVDLLGENRMSGWVFETLLKPNDAQETKSVPVLARMADVVLSAEEMSSVLELLGPEVQENLRNNPEVLQRVIREELVRKSVIKAAIDNGFEKEPLVARLMERSRSQTLADHFLNQQSRPQDDFPSEEEVTEVYTSNIKEYTTPEKLHVGQLFVAVAMDVDKDTALTLADKAKDLAELAGKEGEDFSEIAKKFSEHRPTAEKGGDIGWIEKKALLPEVRDILSDMTVGSVSSPVRSNQGWHIFKLLERKDEVVWPLADVAAEIKEGLRRTKLEENRKNYINELIQRQPISIDQDVFAEKFSK